MSDVITEKESDFERTKRHLLEIKNSIPEFTENINFISKNINLCDIEEIQRSIAYVIVGFRLTEIDLNEIRKS